MLSWLKSLFKPAQPLGPPVSIRKFGPSDRPISNDAVRADMGTNDDAWRIEVPAGVTVRLFELPISGLEQCVLTYRAQMKTADVEGGVYLEMWCAFGGSEYFSKGFHHKAKGTNDWTSVQTPFFLKKGQSPDLLKLYLTFEGRGTVWIKDIELLKTPTA
ncbi:MAG: hypothetical protein ACRD2Y_00365 [Terriglobales bacterium]